MPVEYRNGDLFTFDGALAHGVNCSGVMGKGIAIHFKRDYPKMFAVYRTECKKGKFILGSLYPYEDLKMKFGENWTMKKRWIYNLFIKSHWSLPADETALWATLRAMVKHMEANYVFEVAMPRVGAGLGQLDWETVVKPIIEEVGASTDCTLIVYSH